jgi:hypothetical protein
MPKLYTSYTMKKRNKSTRSAKPFHSRGRTAKMKRSKHLTFAHPHIFQKPNAYGIGTYARKPIPKGTVIIKERPHNITTIARNDPNYIFTLIKHLLEHKRDDFISLVPLKLDNVDTLKYSDIQPMHEKHLPHLLAPFVIRRRTAILY